MDNELRIGVFVCDCGSNIAGVVKVPEVVEFAKTLKNVAYVDEGKWSCSVDALGSMQRAIKENNLNRVVIASCTPRTHEPLFKATVKEAGLNPYLLEFVSIREQVSWVHMLEPEAATQKAKDLVKMGVAKAALLEEGPVPEPEPPNRFETEPGHQAQVAFADVRLPWGKRYALMVVLGYSRLLWVQFYARQTMRLLMRGLEEAFAYLGGVPRELLFDQLRAVVLDDQRPVGGKVIENPEFLRFAAHWGFRIRACPPGRAKTKGKVERPIRYLRQSFLYARDFAGDADLNAQVLHWLATVANVRLQATTKEQPLARFERAERAVLQPLAARPYRSLVLLPDEPRAPENSRPVPRIAVERRPLTTRSANRSARRRRTSCTASSTRSMRPTVPPS